MSAPSLATEAGLAGDYPSSRFNQRERKLLESVKVYVDSLSPDTVITTQGDIIIGSAGGNAARLAKGASDTLLVAGASTVAYAKLVNANVDAAAAIAYSKLNLATSIVNADISGSAAIAYSKLNLATSIVNADINGSAAIAYSKLNLANSLVAGDLTGGSVTLAKLHSGVAPSHVIKFGAQYTTVGGAAAEAITVTGAAATDLAFVRLVNDGTANVTISSWAVTSDTLTVTFSGDPGNDAVIDYILVRAAA